MTERVLVLGGSWFLGRAVVEDALHRGAAVSTFRRGRSGVDVPGAVLIRGDRSVPDDVARLVDGGPWDIVVDTSGFVPRESGVLARALEPATGRFVFVSSVSAYAGWPSQPLTESSPLLECPADAGPDFGFDGDPAPSVYGFTKAGCERAVTEVFGPGRTTILRPGVILGPREYVGRLPWWLRRMQRGGQVLAPGAPDRSIQPVDVRDVAAFAWRAPSGVFNVVGPDSTMEQFLRTCRDTVSAEAPTPASLTWVDDESWLAMQGVRQWTELPLWRSYAGTWAVNSDAASSAGFTSRPMQKTVTDSWTWMQSGEDTVSSSRSAGHGIDPAKEAAILQAWTTRT